MEHIPAAYSRVEFTGELFVSLYYSEWRTHRECVASLSTQGATGVGPSKVSVH